jgi:ABC-type multidrug transport system ATPase subunit
MAATRLPGKPLADIHGRPMIAHVLDRAREAGIGPLAVACAEEEIAEAARAAGARAVLVADDVPSGTDRVQRAMEALEQLELHEYADHYPAMLSGGMQKRLALARAIVTRPEMVFFDEPTAGLDPLRRNAVFVMIAKYQAVFGFTALVVTHDLVEALVASSTVALLHQGEICFCGTPDEFASSPHPVVGLFRDSPDALRSTLDALRRGLSPSEKQE